MKFLLLNTCGAEGSLALADTALGAPIVAATRMPGRTASERLVAELREAMAKARWKVKDLEAIAVVTGPGSFTGVRVGLSVAKGVSEAGDVKLIALSRLALLAVGAGRSCSLLDAGRGEFYCGQYQNGVQLQEALLSREHAMAEALRADAVVVCEEAVRTAFAEIATLRVVAEPTAAEALALAVAQFENGNFADPMTVDANYLRRTDAEIFAPKTVAKVGDVLDVQRQAN